MLVKIGCNFLRVLDMTNRQAFQQKALINTCLVAPPTKREISATSGILSSPVQQAGLTSLDLWSVEMGQSPYFQLHSQPCQEGLELLPGLGPPWEATG